MTRTVLVAQALLLLAGALPCAAQVAPFYFSDWQSSLTNTAADSVVTLRDLQQGVTSTTRIPGDPELNNRKFGLDFEIHGPGMRMPFALPRLGAGGFTVEPTVAVEAAQVDVTFDFHDRSQPELSTSLRGSGPMFGTGLDVATSFCAVCPWTEWSYWYRNLPDLDLDRARPVTAPGQQVIRDRVRLDRETQEVAARTGYVTAVGGLRTVAYVGVLHQRTDVEVDDELTLASPAVGLETAIRTRTRYASDATRALAGVDVQLADSLSGRLEGSTGDGDHGVRFQLLWTLPPRPKPPSRRLQEFAAGGPLVLEYTSRVFVVEAPVRSGWPVAVEYELEQDGHLEIEIAAGGRTETFKLRGPVGERTDKIRFVPRRFARGLEMATFTVRALGRDSGAPVNFRFYGLGIGKGAVASVAVQNVLFGPPQIRGGEKADWSFHCLKSFDDGRTDYYLKFEPPREPGESEMILMRPVWTEKLDRTRCFMQRGDNCEDKWDGTVGRRRSLGWHQLGIVTWNYPGGDSALEMSSDFVEVLAEKGQ